MLALRLASNVSATRSIIDANELLFFEMVFFVVSIIGYKLSKNFVYLTLKDQVKSDFNVNPSFGIAIGIGIATRTAFSIAMPIAIPIPNFNLNGATSSL
jgi:hypothetical protein